MARPTWPPPSTTIFMARAYVWAYCQGLLARLITPSYVEIVLALTAGIWLVRTERPWKESCAVLTTTAPRARQRTLFRGRRAAGPGRGALSGHRHDPGRAGGYAGRARQRQRPGR